MQEAIYPLFCLLNKETDELEYVVFTTIESVGLDTLYVPPVDLDAEYKEKVLNFLGDNNLYEYTDFSRQTRMRVVLPFHSQFDSFSTYTRVENDVYPVRFTNLDVSYLTPKEYKLLSMSRDNSIVFVPAELGRTVESAFYHKLFTNIEALYLDGSKELFAQASYEYNRNSLSLTVKGNCEGLVSFPYTTDRVILNDSCNAVSFHLPASVTDVRIEGAPLDREIYFGGLSILPRLHLASGNMHGSTRINLGSRVVDILKLTVNPRSTGNIVITGGRVRRLVLSTSGFYNEPDPSPLEVHLDTVVENMNKPQWRLYCNVV